MKAEQAAAAENLAKRESELVQRENDLAKRESELATREQATANHSVCKFIISRLFIDHVDAGEWS